MRPAIRRLFAEARAALLDDLQTDPYLRYILLLAVLTTGFWFWHGVPNFATPDEYGRLLRPMKAAGFFFAEPGLAGFARGATDGVAQGASFYLYGFAQVPMFLLVVLTGKLGAFASLAGIESRWTLWHAVPAWFWTGSILISRLVNIGLAVSSVYVLYRLGTLVRNRATGRTASTLFALSLAFIAAAHEANEDVATVLLLLVTLYLATRYARSGDELYFLAGSLVGGLAIAFKLTAGPVVLFIAGAFVLHAIDTRGSLFTALWRPRLLLSGASTGVIAIYVGRPNVLFNGPWALLSRAGVSLASKAEPTYLDAPPLFALLVTALAAVGLPLFLGLIGGSIARLVGAARNRELRDVEWLVVVGLAVYLVVFAGWSDVKPHHLLPAIPLVLLLAAGPITALYHRGDRVGRVLVAGLVVTTALYAGVGTAQYAFAPRDQATDWLESNPATNASVVVYENSVADVAVVHGQPVNHYDFVEKVGVTNQVANESAYTEWMIRTPRNGSTYLQVTDSELRYLDPARPHGDSHPRREAFVRRLVDGDQFGYEVVAEFGDRPTYRSYSERILYAGIDPWPEKLEPYVLVLEGNTTS